MKIKTYTLMFLLLSFIASAGCVGICSNAVITKNNYDITLVEKQAVFTVVAPSFDVCINEPESMIINLSWQGRDAETLSPVKAKGFITAYAERYCKQFWLIPYKIVPGSKAYEYLCLKAKTDHILSGEPESLFKIPLYC